MISFDDIIMLATSDFLVVKTRPDWMKPPGGWCGSRQMAAEPDVSGAMANGSGNVLAAC